MVRATQYIMICDERGDRLLLSFEKNTEKQLILLSEVSWYP